MRIGARGDAPFGAGLTIVGGPSANRHRAKDEERDATNENGRQDERARDIAGSDMHRSRLPCDQRNGQAAPYSTVIMRLPPLGVKRISALQPAGGPDASRRIVPSSSGDPASTVQP
jgi:hypothetical protein